MSKYAVLPAPRFICFGSAKACTNAVNTQGNPEEIVGLGYDD
jgi:hypothetical protein